MALRFPKAGTEPKDSIVFCQCDNDRMNHFRDVVPTMTICMDCGRPTAGWYYTQDFHMLNFFRGGPLDGKLYETETLMKSPSYSAIPIHLYRWTAEKVTMEDTGIIARVWVFKKDDTVVSQASVKRPRFTGNKKKEEPIMAQESTETTPLLDRRKALKLSRSVVAEQAGLTQAKLARIEANGARTTDEERQAVSDALDALTPEGAADPS